MAGLGEHLADHVVPKLHEWLESNTKFRSYVGALDSKALHSEDLLDSEHWLARPVQFLDFPILEADMQEFKRQLSSFVAQFSDNRTGRRARRKFGAPWSKTERLEPRQVLAATPVSLSVAQIQNVLRQPGALDNTTVTSRIEQLVYGGATASELAPLATNSDPRMRDLLEPATMLIPTGETPVHFFLDAVDSVFQDEIGYFFVDGPDGRITRRTDGDPTNDAIISDGLPSFVRPGDADYAEIALGDLNSQVVFARGETPNGSTFDTILDVLGDRYISFFVIQDGTLHDWQTAPSDAKPNVWFSIAGANGDGLDHIQRTAANDVAFREGLFQYKVEDSSVSLTNSGEAAGDTDFNDLVFSVNVVPFVTGDDYSVFNAGTKFNGDPVGFRIDSPRDRVNQGLGLLWNDKSFRPGHGLEVTQVRLDPDAVENAPWLDVRGDGRDHVTLSAPELHGTVTVFPNGGVEFTPDVYDAYWHPKAGDAEPDPIYLQYLVSDGVDTYDAFVSITHGFYQRGATPDRSHQGKRMTFLAGGGDPEPFDVGRTKFFTSGSNRKDIVLVAQGTEQKDFVDQVFTQYAGGHSRGVTSLNITTRDQANDPRIKAIVDGADALWFGGGAQSYYQNIWKGTRLFTSIASAALGNTAIGGTSAGLAILGQSAYIDLPWDSVKSSFAPQRPGDPRINIVRQGSQTLPFTGLSNNSNDPLRSFITDTHFTSRDRMPRIVTFAAQARLRGLAVDESTAVLTEFDRRGTQLWSIYGNGHVYLVGDSALRASYEDFGRLKSLPVNVTRLDTTGHNPPKKLSDLLASATRYQLLVVAGTVYTTENDGSLY